MLGPSLLLQGLALSDGVLELLLDYGLLGNVAEIQNFPTSHQDLSMEKLATRERGVHLHTLEDR